MKILRLITVLMLLPKVGWSLDLGDTHGKVSAVYVAHSYNKNYDSFLVFFDTVQNDRFECLKSNGHLVIRSDAIGVNDNNFQMMYSMAMTAMVSGKAIGISHSGTNPCDNANGMSIRE